MKGTPGDDQAAVLRRHFTRFWGVPGSQVIFKRPKRPTSIWTVEEIVIDPAKVKWSHKGERPNYIRLSTVVKGEKQECWTCENQLRPYNQGK